MMCACACACVYVCVLFNTTHTHTNHTQHNTTQHNKTKQDKRKYISMFLFFIKSFQGYIKKSGCVFVFFLS